MRHRYTPEKERPPPHLNSLLDAEQDAVGAEDVARLAEELDLVQVGRQVVGALVLLPRGAAVLGAEDGAAAADGPADLGVNDPLRDTLGTPRYAMANSQHAQERGSFRISLTTFTILKRRKVYFIMYRASCAACRKLP